MKGQSLIEVLVALGIITIVVTGIITVVTSSLGSTEFGKDQTTATKYAQEGLETVRSIRNSNYTAFATLSGSYCLNSNATTLGPACSAPNVGKFIRTIQIDSTTGCSANVSKVISTVTWQDAKCSSNTYCHQSQLVTCLSRVNPVQAP